jgi:2,3-bisphosphoglycerate-independent phosphoglycerate mutase
MKLTPWQELTRELHQPADTKIVLFVADGLGGLPIEPMGKTELEAAHTPHLDELARRGITGLSIPIGPGIAPGSGPGHLALFGYDPVANRIGRGILEALGVDFPLEPRDVAARGNFCTIDATGRIVDRRAGRIPTEKCVELCAKLSAHVSLPEARVYIQPVREHRFLVVFRGEGLGDRVNDTDPQREGLAPLPPEGQDAASQRTAYLAAQLIAQAGTVLADEAQANMILLRGFSQRPQLPTMQELYGLTPVAIAVYPMYRGLAKLVGMRAVDAGKSLSDQIDALRRHWNEGDFFFLHYKYTDSAGEDGNFLAKVRHLEEIDRVIPDVLALNPDVFIFTGDHSTPCLLRTHSWHPVPTLLVARSCRPDGVAEFGERACRLGGLGLFQATELLPLALAHAGRLARFGA